MDERRLRALREETLDWRFKAVPPAAQGMRLDRWLETEPHADDLDTPSAVLSAAALEHNLAEMASWCAARDLVLAPHGKATMAPQLWRRQLDAGAVGITVANLPQARVARSFGVERLVIANEITSPAGVSWLSDWARSGARIAVFADSAEAVAILAGGGPFEVLVELGADGGRAGARRLEAAAEVASAVRSAPNLRLAGVGGYEGAVADVDGYLADLAALFAALDFEADRPVVTAGGSAHFDRVAAVLGPLADRAEVVLRSGSYLVHDHGFYARLTPAARGADAPRFRPALTARSRVLSCPEPGLAILDAGRRDVPFDQDLPLPLDLEGAECSQISDQHLFLTGAVDRLAVGEVVRLGLSHPCTSFDKWSLIPVADEQGRVVDAVRTCF